MHPNFFHWHAHVSIKPDPAILEPRWAAAAIFGEELSADDVVNLLRMVLLPTTDTAFAKRFTDELVKAEPTFPIEHNAEILRTMAAAVVSSNIEERTGAGDAFALGLLSSEFLKDQTNVLFNDVAIQATNYLSNESERLRPAFQPGTLKAAKKKVEKQLEDLHALVASTEIAQVTPVVEKVGRELLTALETSHMHVHEALVKLGEESQCLWWLIGRRSSKMGKPRAALKASEYALVGAVELIARIELTPPPESGESLLIEALHQCSDDSEAIVRLDHVVQAAVPDLLDDWDSLNPITTPICCLLASKAGKSVTEPMGVDLSALQNASTSAQAAAIQLFRELAFMNALALID